MKEIIQLLEEAQTHAQITEIVNAYGMAILLDNHLSNCLRDARVRVNKKNLEEVVWEVYQLN